MIFIIAIWISVLIIPDHPGWQRNIVQRCAREAESSEPDFIWRTAIEFWGEEEEGRWPWPRSLRPHTLQSLQQFQHLQHFSHLSKPRCASYCRLSILSRLLHLDIIILLSLAKESVTDLNIWIICLILVNLMFKRGFCNLLGSARLSANLDWQRTTVQRGPSALCTVVHWCTGAVHCCAKRSLKSLPAATSIRYFTLPPLSSQNSNSAWHFSNL